MVNIVTKDFGSTWSINDAGALSVGDAERSPDGVVQGGWATLDQVARVPGDDTIVQKLSPRCWSFAWRLRGGNAIVGEMQFLDRRDAVSEADAALIRLVCSAGIYGEGSAFAAPTRAKLSWPQVDRRGHRKPPWSAWLAPALLLATALLAAWLALVAVPDARELAKARQLEIEQRRAMADGTMVQGLSLALASGDYGDVQSALSSFASLGYFRSAAVVNAGERVVAVAGPAEGARIGEKLASQSASAARALKLGIVPDKSGQLLLLSEATPTSPQTPMGAVPAAALTTLAAALAAAALFVWQLLRRKR